MAGKIQGKNEWEEDQDRNISVDSPSGMEREKDLNWLDA